MMRQWYNILEIQSDNYKSVHTEERCRTMKQQNSLFLGNMQIRSDSNDQNVEPKPTDPNYGENQRSNDILFGSEKTLCVLYKNKEGLERRMKGNTKIASRHTIQGND